MKAKPRAAGVVAKVYQVSWVDHYVAVVETGGERAVVRSANVVIEVDFERVAKQLGVRAARSKGREARCMNGAVLVRVAGTL